MAAFVQQHLEDVAKEFVSDEDLLTKIDVDEFQDCNNLRKFFKNFYFQKNRRNIIAHIPPQSTVERDNFRRISANLREDCSFWITSGYKQ